jgi:hypothetical protein
MARPPPVRLGRAVALNKIVLNTGCFMSRKNALEINHTLADIFPVSKRILDGLLVFKGGKWIFKHHFFFHILHMNCREPAGILIEVIHGIVTGHFYPKEIQLHGHEVRLRRIEQQIIGNFALHFPELETVIVVSKLQACFLAFFSDYVKLVGQLFVIIDILTLIRSQERTYKVVNSYRMGGFNGFWQIILECSQAQVCSRCR